ncbi:MAG TPA: thermonuclease family protein [Methylomirabilota bacterium]|nr:thermonuclease family protein [Methylomirabilota bacterium]
MPRLRPGVLAAVLLVLVTAAAASAASVEGPVVRVVDGDTIHVSVGGRIEKVRYIGINTPELHHPQKGEEPGGREAADLNRALLGTRHVRLETDVQTRDRYGRLLAYVWVGDTMVNAELVRRGYAQVMTVPPNVRHQALFVKLQRDAREAGRGLWRSPPASAAPAASLR